MIRPDRQSSLSKPVRGRGRVFSLSVGTLFPILLALFLCSGPATTAAATSEALPDDLADLEALLALPTLPAWSRELKLSSSFGYRTNYRLSAVDPAGSTVHRIEGEWFLWPTLEFPGPGHVFFSGQVDHFTAADPVERDLLFLAQGEWRPPAAERRVAFSLTWIYLDQVLDLSPELGLPVIARVRGHLVESSARAELRLPGEREVRFSLHAREDGYRERLFRGREARASARIALLPPGALRLYLEPRLRLREFPHRFARSLDGTLLPGEPLRLQLTELEATASRRWRETGRLNARLSLLVRRQSDGQEGYDRARRFGGRFFLDQEFETFSWELETARTKQKWPNRTAGEETRRRSESSVRGQLSKRLTASLTATASCEWERTRGDTPNSSYTDRRWMLGLERTW
ncbi:MAG: hypothetical protein EA425_05235 [Puniceicoccaceae bacterium]|nr:MAG: hypothetical protein EA425_05235 [Puniceicoccaceae bacterium]